MFEETPAMFEFALFSFELFETLPCLYPMLGLVLELEVSY
jgi:hypothetical protein